MSRKTDSKEPNAPSASQGMDRRTMLRTTLTGAAALFVAACGDFQPKAIHSAETEDLFGRGGLSSPAGLVGSTVNVEFTMQNLGGVDIPCSWTAAVQSQSAVMKFPGGMVPGGQELVPVGGTVVRGFPLKIMSGNPGDTAEVTVNVTGNGIPLRFSSTRVSVGGPCATAFVAAAGSMFAQGKLSANAATVGSMVNVDFSVRNLSDQAIPYHWSASVQSDTAVMEFPGGMIPSGNDTAPPGATVVRSFPVQVVAGNPGDTALVSVMVNGNGAPLRFTSAEVGQVGPCCTATVAAATAFTQGTLDVPSGSVGSTVNVRFTLRNLGSEPIPYHWNAGLQSGTAVVEFPGGVVPSGDETLQVGDTIERAFPVRIVAGNPGDTATVFAFVNGNGVPLQFTSKEIGLSGPCATLSVA